MKTLWELRAELRKLGQPTTGLKKELEQRIISDAAKRKAIAEDAAMEGMEDEVQGEEKPGRMKEVRQFINLQDCVCMCSL